MQKECVPLEPTASAERPPHPPTPKVEQRPSGCKKTRFVLPPRAPQTTSDMRLTGTHRIQQQRPPKSGALPSKTGPHLMCDPTNYPHRLCDSVGFSHT